MQASRTDEQSHTVVLVFREIRKCHVDAVRIISGILLGYAVVLQSLSVLIVCCLCRDGIPDFIEICIAVSGVAYDHVVCDFLIRVRKSCPVLFSGISGSCPAVRLDTDRYIDLRYFKRTAYVAYRVVVIRWSSRYDSILRSDRCDAGCKTSVSAVSIRVLICKVYRSQRMTVLESFNSYLLLRQLEHFAVILLACAERRYGRLLLIEQSELESVRRGLFSDLIV